MTSRRGRGSVDDAVAGLSREAADEARAAFDWLLPDGGDLDDLTQHDLQTFLWYSLPMKWLTDESHHLAVASALGDALAAADVDRYAALCRAAETRHLIARWETDPAGARKDFRRMMADSGVDPFDTSVVCWGSVQGSEEFTAFGTASVALEAAIDDGRVRPGSRNWKSAAGAVIDAAVLERSADGRTLLEQIETERLGWWLDRQRRNGLAIGTELADHLRAGVSEDAARSAKMLAAVGATLEPLTWFLSEVGDGVRMTQAGYLPRALVLAADHRYDWFDLKPRFSIRTEHDLRELHLLHALARRERFVTLRRGTLSISARGRALLSDPADLAGHVLRAMSAESTWEGDVGLAALTFLVQRDGNDPVARDDLARAVTAYLKTHWRTGGEPVSAGAVSPTLHDVLRLCDVFGWREPLPGPRWSAVAPLNVTGRRAAVMALQLVAVGPRDRP